MTKTTAPTPVVWAWLTHQPARRFGVREIAREMGVDDRDLGKTLAQMNYRNEHEDVVQYPGLVKVRGHNLTYIWTPGQGAPPEDRDPALAGLVPLDEAIPWPNAAKTTARWLVEDVANQRAVSAMKAPRPATRRGGAPMWFVDPTAIRRVPLYLPSTIATATDIDREVVRAAYDAGDIAVEDVQSGDRTYRLASYNAAVAWLGRESTEQRPGMTWYSEEAPTQVPAQASLDDIADDYWADHAQEWANVGAEPPDPGKFQPGEIMEVVSVSGPTEDGVYDVAVRTETGRLIVGYF